MNKMTDIGYLPGSIADKVQETIRATLWYRVTIIDDCKKRGVRVPDKPGWY